MSANIFGNLLKLVSFGESHGPAIGGVIEGLPAGIEIDLDFARTELGRRRTAQNSVSSPRKESDEIEILSGVFEGKSIGSPIAFIIRNQDQRSKDYSHLRDHFRPGHADMTSEMKYGHRDHRGGGRSSARETAVRVAASAMIRKLVPELKLTAYVSSIGPFNLVFDEAPNTDLIEASELRIPNLEVSEMAKAYLSGLIEKKDSSGGIIHCFIEEVPKGLGEPVYHKLQADLSSAMMGINAVKAFELGSGFSGVLQSGEQYYGADEKYHSGGIYGGISSGDPIHFKVGFKPISSSARGNALMDRDGNKTELETGGRHDVCVVPRAVPIVEAMARWVILDHYLLQKTQKVV